MSTVSDRAEQCPSDAVGQLSRYLRTAGLLERLDPAFARAADELVGHPHRAGVLSSTVRALVVLAVESVIPEADEPCIAAAVDQALREPVRKRCSASWRSPVPSGSIPSRSVSRSLSRKWNRPAPTWPRRRRASVSSRWGVGAAAAAPQLDLCLLSIAIDAVSPQHYVDGLRKHIREAVQL